MLFYYFVSILQYFIDSIMVSQYKMQFDAVPRIYFLFGETWHPIVHVLFAPVQWIKGWFAFFI